MIGIEHIAMKQFTYTSTKNGRTIFVVEGPNFWNASHADKRLKEVKGIDMVTTPFITCVIKSLPDTFSEDNPNVKKIFKGN